MEEGNLYCTLCNKQLQTPRGYKSHLNSRMHLQNVERHDTSNITRMNEYINYLKTLPTDIEVKRVFDDYSYSEYKKVFSVIDEPEVDVRFLFNDEHDVYDETAETDETFYDILYNFYNIFRKSFKCYMNVEVRYTKTGPDGNIEEIIQGHFSKTQEIHNVEDIEPIFEIMIIKLKDAILEAQLRESGWKLVKVISKKLVINKYKNNTGGSYIPLPFSSPQIINIQNDDQYCFLWSVIAHLHPAQYHKERISHYNKEEYLYEFDLSDGLDEFPYDYNKLTKFHKKNKDLIEVNVFELNIKYISVGNITPLYTGNVTINDTVYANVKEFYISNKRLCQTEIQYNERGNYIHHNIIYQDVVICTEKYEIKKTLTPIMINHNNYKGRPVTSGDQQQLQMLQQQYQQQSQMLQQQSQMLQQQYQQQLQQQYQQQLQHLIQPAQANILYYQGHYILCKDVSIFTKTSDHTNFPCLQCMTSFRTKQALNNHLVNCQQNEAVRNTFPKEDYLEYNKWHYKNKVPFVIYCDFEAYNVKITDKCNNNLFEQKPLCWGMYIHSNYPNLFQSEYYQYYGEDSAIKFVNTIEELQERFSQLLKTNKPMLPLTSEQLVQFNNEKNCYYCGKELVTDKVKDHDHLNGLYRGAAHNSCNLNANKFRYNFVPLYFYNGSKYDFHLIIKELFSSKILQQLRTNILCKTEEEYFSMQFGCIRILDAFRFFTPYSLEAMGKTLKPEQCSIK